MPMRLLLSLPYPVMLRSRVSSGVRNTREKICNVSSGPLVVGLLVEAPAQLPRSPQSIDVIRR